MTEWDAPLRTTHRQEAEGYPAIREGTGHRRLSYGKVHPQTLPDRERDTLYSEIRDVMLAAANAIQTRDVEKSWVDEVIETRRSQGSTAYDFVLVRDGEKLAGVFGYRLFNLCGRRCLEMVSGYVLPEYQDYGIGLAVSARLLFSTLASRPGSGVFVLMEVMNPVVVAGWRKRIPKPEAMYPSLAGARHNPTLIRVAHEFMSGRPDYSSFDPETGVIHGAHLGRDGQRDTCSDQVVAEYFHAHVDHAAGDTLLMILDGSRSNLISSTGQLARAIPRSLLRSIRTCD